MNILITGGASGLGEAITRKLASERDLNIIFTYSESERNAKSIEKNFSNTRSIKCDFRLEKDLNELIHCIQNANINVLVNNAYSTSLNQKHFHKTEPELFHEGFLANILPVIKISQAAIKGFIRNKSGRLITILSSVLIDKPAVGWSEYTAGKAYLQSLCKSWASEYSRFNITSNSVSPSFMRTKLTENIDDRIIKAIEDLNPTKKLLTIEEVADTVYFLINCSQQVNGVNIVLNGGEHVI